MWLIERALEHERPSLLLAELCGELGRRGIERPAVAEAMRLVAWARERAHEQTFERLAPQLTDPVRARLDGLLVTGGGQCEHAWLRSRPTSVSAKALRHDRGARRLEPLGYDALVRMFRAGVRRGGIREPWVIPHALRHTHATRMWEGGMRS